MRIAGLQKLTLLDYPGRMAATVFCPACDFRCPFCHNASLVVPGPEGFLTLDQDEVRAFLEKRRGILDGVCITGGEPLLQPDIADFCAGLKEMGFAVKLDTNGSFPATLKALVERGLVDYVAMDVKAVIGVRTLRDGECASAVDASPCGSVDSADSADQHRPSGGFESVRRFAEVVGVDVSHAPSLMEAVGESAAFLMSGMVPYEFRTTVTREFHDASHLREMAEQIRTAEAWYLQGFVDSEDVIAGRGMLHGYSDREMHALVEMLRPLVPSVRLRGVD